MSWLSLFEEMKILVGITGGIGSGKSIVSKICRIKGFPVYDCDSRAKILMHSSKSIKEKLIEIVGEQVIMSNGSINTTILADKIFSNSIIRNKVNFVVHNAVRSDIEKWIEQQKTEIIFIESAILHTSHLDEFVDSIWYVDASEEERIRRVEIRNNISKEEIKKRISSQKNEMDNLPIEKLKIINNNGQKSLVEQINHFINQMSNKKISITKI